MIKLQAVCTRIIDNPQNGMEAWQWGQGVALYGLIKAYNTTGENRYIDYVKSWLDGHLSASQPGKSINTTMPVLAALKVHQLSYKAEYLELCEDFAQWCMAQAPRSEYGAFEHSCTENVYPNQIWADTLFMGCLFLAEYSLHTKIPMYMHEALRQFVLHYKFLGDSETGLIRHGYYGNEREQVGMLWGRGNGWFSCASPLILEMADDGYELKKQVRDNFIRHTMGLIKFQNSDGSWNTVIDSKSSYPETTGTVSFAYAIKRAVEFGYIDAKYRENADRAYEYINKNIDADGTLMLASGGTCVMKTAAEYNAIPYNFSPFAQGLAMISLS